MMDTFDQTVLSAIRALGDNAYAVTIHQAIEKALRRPISYGAMYIALGRLETAKKVESSLGEATPERGMRRKRFYRVMG